MTKLSAQKGIAPLVILVIIGTVIAGVFVTSKVNFAPKQSGQTTQTNQQKEQVSDLYSNFDAGFSIEAPENWRIDEYPDPDDSTIVVEINFAEGKVGEKDHFTESIAISAATTKTNLDEALNGWLAAFEEKYNNAKLISKEKTNLAGSEAYKLIQTGNYKVDNDKVKHLTYLLVKDDKSYILNFLGDEATFDKFLPEVERSLQSFKLVSRAQLWENYTSDKYGYSVKIPKGWSVTDKPSETSREISIVHPQNKALVLITSLKDESLKDMNYMKDSVAQFKKEMENNPLVTKIYGFKDEYDKDSGAFIARGLEKREGQDWYFEQRGVLSTKGRVTLFHGEVLSNMDKEYIDIIAGIIESFKTD